MVAGILRVATGKTGAVVVLRSILILRSGLPAVNAGSSEQKSFLNWPGTMSTARGDYQISSP